MGAQQSGQVHKTIGQIPFDDAFPGRAVGFVHDLHLDDRLTLASVADLADRLPRRSVIADTAAQPFWPLKGSASGCPGTTGRRDTRSAQGKRLAHPAQRGSRSRHGRTHEHSARPTRVGDDRQARQARQDAQTGGIRLCLLPKFGHAGPFRHRAQPVDAGRWEQDRQHRALRERRRSTARDRQVLGRLPRTDRDSASGGGRIHGDARAGGVHTPGTPHWVHNGPDISLSVTLTYFTAATVRENRIEDFNSHLRRRHMKPREPGRSATVDTAKVCAMGVYAIGQRLRSASAGMKRRHDQEPADGAG